MNLGMARSALFFFRALLHVPIREKHCKISGRACSSMAMYSSIKFKQKWWNRDFGGRSKTLKCNLYHREKVRKKDDLKSEKLLLMCFFSLFFHTAFWTCRFFRFVS